MVLLSVYYVIMKSTLSLEDFVMFARSFLPELKDTARHYPIVGVMGPRQSGKTTAVQSAFPDKPYANLEEPDVRLLASSDPRSFLDRYPDGAILDEIQRVPELLSYIQSIVDRKQKNGMFIVTGSHQLELHQAISQSLAGRIGLLNLYPMTLHELKLANIQLEINAQLLHGFYPGVFSEKLNPTKAYRNYVQTYIEKDVRKISEIKDLVLFNNFMKLCAGRIGQVLDYASLSNELGISSHTVKHWLSVLEASYIIVRLQPYFENFGKRIIKSPKLYFTDVGLACYLLGIETIDQIERDPLRGHLVENLVVLELIKYRYNRGLEPNIYYFRDSNRNEVDIIIKQGNELIPVEIKSSKTYTRGFIKGLNYFKNLVGDRVERSYLIYAGEQEQVIQDVKLINFRHATEIFKRDE